MNQWLGVVAWHLMPVFYRFYCTATNKPKPYNKVFQPQLPKFTMKDIMKDIKEYKSFAIYNI